MYAKYKQKNGAPKAILVTPGYIVYTTMAYTPNSHVLAIARHQRQYTINLNLEKLYKRNRGGHYLYHLFTRPFEIPPWRWVWGETSNPYWPKCMAANAQ